MSTDNAVRENVESTGAEHYADYAGIVPDDVAAVFQIASPGRPAQPVARDVQPVSLRQARRRYRIALQGEQFVILPSGNQSWPYRSAKRALDIIGALFFLVLFSPMVLVTFLVLLVTTKGKPIFCQERVGLCGRTFRMFKFRTMYPDADRRQHLVENQQDGPIFKHRRDPRVTPLGRWLRTTSIDETPQLFNVLAGHMSLVGPRPPVPKEVAQYKPWQRARLTVKPGLTCLWQVSGRSEIGFEDWVRMDLWYRKNQNLQTDLKLLWKTPLSVISRRGAY